MRNKNIWIISGILFISIFVTMNTYQAVSAQKLRPVEEVQKIHPVPKVPMVVDGVKMAPEEIVKFDGQDLYYLVNEEAKAQGIVFVFTTLDGIQKAAMADNISPAAQYNCQQPTDVWKEVDFHGTFKTLHPWYGIGQGSFSGSSWDNNIESVHTTYCNYTKFFDNTNYTGSQLWLATSGWTSWLVPYGWDNRASSWKIEP